MSQQSRIENIMQKINSLKSNEKIFELLLKEQSNYQCNKSTSEIILGNSDAHILVTILTNPHCNPCARMHKRIEQLLNESDNLYIQYVFSSLDLSLYTSNKFLIAACLNSKEKDMFSIYNESKGKSTTGWFFVFKLHLIINDRGEILIFAITRDNVDDRQPLGMESFV